MIARYFEQFDKIISRVDFISSLEIHKRKVNDFLGIIEGRITIDGKILEILEVIKITGQNLSVLKYKYHFRDPDDYLIFRYDNAPHHKEIDTFPHHLHLPDKIVSSKKPTLSQILSTIYKGL